MSYFDRALLAVTVISALAGLSGVFIVLRRRVLFAQALTHATFPGAVIATVLGASVSVGALIATVVATAILLLLGRIRGQGTQAASGVILTAGFALGMVLRALNPQIPLNVESFLFGSVLGATWIDVLTAGAALVAVLVVLLFWGRRLTFSIFDPEGYQAAGLSPITADALLLAIAAITVVVSLPVGGAILTIALIAAPAATARNLTDRISLMFVIAPLLGVATGIVGLFVSKWFGFSAGASIAVVAAFLFALSWLPSRLSSRWGSRRVSGVTSGVKA